MVTTRQRTASAAALRELSNRLDSGEVTAGPFTLNKIDPKVSISGARVDRQGLHVSLTIPLDSSSSVSSRTRTRTATNNQPHNTTAAAFTQQLPQGSPLTRSAARRSSRSPKAKTLSAAAAAAAAADVATQTSQEHNSKAKGFRRAARSPQKERQSRSPVAAPSPSPPVAAAAEKTAAAEHEASRGVKKGSRKNNRSSSSSNTPQKRNTSPTNAVNSSAPTISPLGFEAPTARHSLQAALLETSETDKHQGSNNLSAIDAATAAQNLHARGTSGGGASQADGNVANQGLTTQMEETFEGLAGETEILALQDSYDEAPHLSFIIIRKVFTKLTTWPLIILFALFLFFYKNEALLMSLFFPFSQTSGFLLSNKTREFIKGSFYLFEGFHEYQCQSQEDSCSKREDNSLCWISAEDPLKGCVDLGEDVTGRGSIDYSLTTGAVPLKALRLSLLLHKLASFAMPRFPPMRPSSLPISLDTSEGETATLRHSYFPLYNHDNDPGKLLKDSSSATYIITQAKGQVVVSLPHQTSIAAVAFETPAALNPHRNQCGPLEIRRFAVYVHLEDSIKPSCPQGALTAAEEEKLMTWCKVATFEYRCSASPSLQVFCLHAFSPSPKTDDNNNNNNNNTACDLERGWTTDKIKFLFENNWGAEATRVRRLRILAEPNYEKLRLQLCSVNERFAGFKSSIAEDSRKRRLLEEEKYRQINEALKALETGVSLEAKKRGEANRLMQRVAENLAEEMLQRIQNKITKHIGHLTGVLDQLITRCEKLEQGLMTLKGEEAENLSRQSAELMARCKATRAAFLAEVRATSERENAANEKLENLLKNLDFKIDKEIAARHQQLSLMKRDIELLLRGDQPHEQFHTFVEEELLELKESLISATKIREQADDEILQAITEYTVALQKGLQNVGGLGST